MTTMAVRTFTLGLSVGVVLLTTPAAHGGVAPDLKCSGAKAKAVGLKAATVLHAFMVNKKKPAPGKLAKSLSKAGSKFTKAFDKAESKGGCSTNGDAGAIEGRVDSFVTAVVDALCPSDTSTTSTSTTSTSSTTTSTIASSSSSTTTSTTTSTTVPVGSLVINEIDYDQVNGDDREFVEVFNGGGTAVDLATMALVFVNGANGNEYRRVALSPALALGAGSYLVVGSALVAVPPGVPRLDLPASSAIQNGPDGVALIDTATPTVLDSLSYEGEITAANITGFSTPVNLVEGSAFGGADSGAEIRSLIRSPNGTDTDSAANDWTETGAPTPGEANP